MRRLAVPGALLLLALAVYAVFRREPAHISELVPEDFSFGVFTGSINDLRQLYEAPYRRKDADPAHLRFGRPANVPGFSGVAYDEPAGSFLTAEHEEILLLPVRDPRALGEEFERARENIRLLEPRHVAKNYASLSERRVVAERGPRNDLVLRASRYALALCGHPADALALRLMLVYLLQREAEPKPPGAPLLVHDASRLPRPVAEAIARECEDLLVGFPVPRAPDAPVRVEIEEGLATSGMIARSAHLATELDLTDVARSFPGNTTLFAGLVLDAKGWSELGVPLPLGDAAFACGIVEEKIHARRFTILLAARPRRDEDLARLRAEGHTLLLGGISAGPWTSVADQTAEVRTAEIAAPPAWLEGVLASEAQAPPPVYVSMTVERKIWYCAIGSQAEGVVRHALGCLRDMPLLGLARTPAVAAHPEFLQGAHVGLAMATVQGLRAFDRTMPVFEIASIGQPPHLTAVLDVDDRAKVDLRIAR